VGRLLNLIDHYGFDYAINQEFAQVVEQLLGIKVESSKIYDEATGEQPAQSIMVCCGGDGTLLEGIHRLSNKQIPVAAINFGRLGFLTSATRDDVEELFALIARGEIDIQPRTLLTIESSSIGRHTALNEVAAQRLEATMIQVEARVNNQLVAQYNGDGVIVATPTGSTAYNLSAGGPIVEPEAKNILVTPICAHDMTSRCMIASDRRVIEVELTRNARRNAFLSVDGGKALRLNMGDLVTIKKSPFETKLVRLKDRSFYDVLNTKFKEY
jgi:NAD+ kinase